MKKALAILLSLALCFCLATVALADDPPPAQPGETGVLAIDILYEGSEDDDLPMVVYEMLKADGSCITTDEIIAGPHGNTHEAIEFPEETVAVRLTLYSEVAPKNVSGNFFWDWEQNPEMPDLTQIFSTGEKTFTLQLGNISDRVDLAFDFVNDPPPEDSRTPSALDVEIFKNPEDDVTVTYDFQDGNGNSLGWANLTESAMDIPFPQGTTVIVMQVGGELPVKAAGGDFYWPQDQDRPDLMELFNTGDREFILPLGNFGDHVSFTFNFTDGNHGPDDRPPMAPSSLTVEVIADESVLDEAHQPQISCEFLDEEGHPIDGGVTSESVFDVPFPQGTVAIRISEGDDDMVPRSVFGEFYWPADQARPDLTGIFATGERTFTLPLGNFNDSVRFVFDYLNDPPANLEPGSLYLRVDRPAWATVAFAWEFFGSNGTLLEEGNATIEDVTEGELSFPEGIETVRLTLISDTELEDVRGAFYWPENVERPDLLEMFSTGECTFELPLGHESDRVEFSFRFSNVLRYLRGDVNEDDAVNASDALLVLKNTVGKQAFTPRQTMIAHVNEDDKIDASDALMILKISVGKLPQERVEVEITA